VKGRQTEMKRIEQVYKMAQEIRNQWDNDGIFDYEKNREMEEVAYEYGISIYFDEDNIPEYVEDERV
jgi:hypothetical protein